MISGLTLKTLPKEQRILGIESCIFFSSFSQSTGLGQTSTRVCLVKGKKYIEQLRQVHVSTLSNPYNTFDQSM